MIEDTGHMDVTDAMRAALYAMPCRSASRSSTGVATMPDDYDPIVDTWRSIWEALAIVNGDDPDAAVAGHKRLCEAMAANDEQEM